MDLDLHSTSCLCIAPVDTDIFNERDDKSHTYKKLLPRSKMNFLYNSKNLNPFYKGKSKFRFSLHYASRSASEKVCNSAYFVIK